jgi:hypothetical protein
LPERPADWHLRDGEWYRSDRTATARLLSEGRKRRAPLLETVALVVVIVLGLTLCACLIAVAAALVLVL